MIAHVLGIILISILIIGCFLTWRYEKRRYNNGYCSCGARWLHLDCDSQGGDIWKCERCRQSFWSSWIRPKNIYYGKIKYIIKFATKIKSDRK